MARQLRVNGRAVDLDGVAPGTLLSTWLRESLCMTGTKIGCGMGECGACTVLVDGQPRMACITLVAAVDQDVQTIEGLADESADLRLAFAQLGAFQCGFCTPGQVVRAVALLREPMPQDPEAARTFVAHQMSGNLCRCTGYAAILEAVLQCAVPFPAREPGAPS